MSFIRHHWFGLFMSLFVFTFFVLFILVLISPRQDIQKRGFIPCTEAMVEELSTCQQAKSYSCMFGSIIENSWCELKVIGQGFALWTKGEQTSPWSNYIFEPEIVQDDDNFDDEARAEYLKNNPDFATEMQELRRLNKELENEEQQYEQGQQPEATSVVGSE